MNSALVRAFGLTAILALGPFTGAQAQASAASETCTEYAACALRVKHGFFKTKIVRGADDTELADIGFRTPPVRDVFQVAPEALVAYDLFGADHRRSSWTGALGFAGFLGGMIAGAKGGDDWAAGLSVGGTVFSLISGIFRTKANEHLSGAVWHYNASLSAAGNR